MIQHTVLKLVFYVQLNLFESNIYDTSSVHRQHIKYPVYVFKTHPCAICLETVEATIGMGVLKMVLSSIELFPASARTESSALE